MKRRAATTWQLSPTSKRTRSKPQVEAGRFIPAMANPWGDWDWAYDINDDGQIVGSTAYVGWLFNTDGTFETSPGPFPQNNRTGMFGLNSYGLVLAGSDNGVLLHTRQPCLVLGPVEYAVGGLGVLVLAAIWVPHADPER